MDSKIHVVEGFITDVIKFWIHNPNLRELLEQLRKRDVRNGFTQVKWLGNDLVFPGMIFRVEFSLNNSSTVEFLILVVSCCFPNTDAARGKILKLTTEDQKGDGVAETLTSLLSLSAFLQSLSIRSCQEYEKVILAMSYRPGLVKSCCFILCNASKFAGLLLTRLLHSVSNKNVASFAFIFVATKELCQQGYSETDFMIELRVPQSSPYILEEFKTGLFDYFIVIDASKSECLVYELKKESDKEELGSRDKENFIKTIMLLLKNAHSKAYFLSSIPYSLLRVVSAIIRSCTSHLH
ncbi:hypothetical protein K7X08_031943 [Anisodus acutangulus]|uniref:Uncharacterized protein n=1 Tax=Anisodus acutangulus TaxID=402998 RepID=A0A9Q1MMM3_9SOLA|nr:hypothetical protein K7X08_031943 [Anisodus acutangulus]